MTKYTFENINRPPVSDSALKQVHPLVLDILYRRGYTTETEMKSFLFPDYRTAIRPLACKDVDAAIQVLAKAVREKQTIVVYRDYDVDGISAGAVAIQSLSKLGATVHQYANEREVDGYGICKNGVRTILKRWPETRVILTVDNGVVAQEAIDYANDMGLVVVVTDHHEPGDTLPNAAAVVDLKRKDETYPFHELCGCGLIFRVMIDLYRFMKKDPTPVFDMIDIVALATVADIVPLIGENRTLVQQGLARMESGTRPFFNVMARVFGVSDITAHYTVAFLFAPTLNSLSRMNMDTDAAVDALLCEDSTRVEQLVLRFKDVNQLRKDETERQFNIAMQKLGENYSGSAIVLQDDAFTEGIVGIIAGRLKNEFHRPVVVFAGTRDGKMKGSGRSIEQFPLHENLRKMQDLLEGFGGHAMAAGLTVDAGNFEAFKNAFLALADKTLTPDDFIAKIPLSAVLEERELSEHFVRELRLLEPYGEAFPEPVFGLKASCTDVRYMGKDSQHLKFLTDTGLSVIAWNEAERFRTKHRDGSALPKKFVGRPQLNVWMDNVSVQFICADR